MKKVLFFSDSHGNKSAVAKLFERHAEFDKIIFAGYGKADIEDYLYAFPDKVVAVRGNCDIGGSLPEQAVLTVGGVKLLVTHGHRYGAKYGTDALLFEAMKHEAQAVLYGHTHRAKIHCEYGITLVNAGTLSERNGNVQSFVEIEITKGNIFARIVKMP